MPRIRSIKPEFCVSDQIVECSTNARLLFVLMWMFCDDRGIHPASFTKVKAECFPADPFTPDQIKVWIDELIKSRLLGRFIAEGIEYWQVTGWKHQKIDRPSFKFPVPECLSFDEYSTNDVRGLVGRHPPESKGVEGSRVEGSYAPPSALPTIASSGVVLDKPNTTPVTSTSPPPSSKGTRFKVEKLTLAERTAWFDFCRSERPELDAIKTLDSFSDFWVGRPGSAGVKLDWTATWRNWVRNQKAVPGSVKGMPAAAVEYLRRQDQPTEREIPGERVG